MNLFEVNTIFMYNWPNSWRMPVATCICCHQAVKPFELEVRLNKIYVEIQFLIRREHPASPVQRLKPLMCLVT
jgi:hypothetical protein